MADVLAMPGAGNTPAAILAELAVELPNIASIACVVRFNDGTYARPRSKMSSSEMALSGGVLLREAVDSCEFR